jgi:hypothetical protein
MGTARSTAYTKFKEVLLLIGNGVGCAVTGDLETPNREANRNKARKMNR